MTAYNKNDPATIQALFDSIAKQYDKTNGVLSFQMHKKWNKALIEQAVLPCQPTVLLDICCGTGAIAFEYLQHTKMPVKAYMLDFSAGMLAHAQKLATALHLQRHDINYLKADAQVIPLEDDSVDCATMAYGIRNVSQPQTCIHDVYRVLKPGAAFGILELTQPQNPLLRFGHNIYLRTLLPVMGKFLTSNREAYQYLCNSINTFIPPEQLEHLMRAANFMQIRRQPLLGGVATLLIGRKTKE